MTAASEPNQLYTHNFTLNSLHTPPPVVLTHPKPVLLLLFSSTAITTSSTCSAASGTWTNSTCSVTIQPPCSAAGGSWSPRAMWSLEGGMDLLIVGLLQGGLSYPYFDPVLTGKLGQGLSDIPLQCMNYSNLFF